MLVMWAVVEAQSHFRSLTDELRDKTERLAGLSTRSTEKDAHTQLAEERLISEVTIEHNKEQRGDSGRGESEIGIFASVARLKVQVKPAALAHNVAKK